MKLRKRVACLMAAMMLVGATPAFADIADENVVWEANLNTKTGELTVLTDNTTPAPTYAPLANNAIRMVVNNKELSATGVSIDGRTLVPLRAIGEALGAAVQWDAGKQEIRIEKMLYQADSRGVVTDSNRIILMNVGSKQILENGTARELDVAPQIINGSTMVPVRAVTDFLEATVNWDDASRTVTVQASMATTAEGALKEQQNLQIDFGNAVANRVEEINREYEIERIKKETEYIKENKPKGDLTAWGYSLDYDVRSLGDYGAYISFDIYPGGYQSTKTKEDVEKEWFWFEVIDKKTDNVVYKTTFIYNEVEKKLDERMILFPSKTYADEDKYNYKFTVVMDREEATEYRQMESMRNEAIKQQGNPEDWGYEIKVTQIYNIQVGIQPWRCMYFVINTNPLKYSGGLRDQIFRVEVVNKSTGQVEYEEQFSYKEVNNGSNCSLELPSEYLYEDKYNYEFYVVE